MEGAITLKPAYFNDLPFIVEVYNQSIPAGLATADHQPIAVEERVNWFHAHTTTTHPLWLVCKEEQPVGWLSFNKFYDRQAYAGVVEVSLYLHSSYHGKGIGKICLALAIEESRRRNIHTLLALIFSHNAISVKLFEEAGFKKWGYFPQVADMPNGWRDLLIYGLKVNPNITTDIE